jgi:hypothetical protein
MKINMVHCASVAAFALGMSGTASADFIGDNAIANWTVTDNAGGVVDTSAAPASITLTSGNSGIAGDTFFTIAAAAAETISFNWSYVTNDLWGQSGTDAFGYVINGNVTTLIDPNQDFTIPTQSGTATFAVNAGDVFGFNANTFDGLYGSSVTVVSNFTAAPVSAVPVPGAAWLFGSALAGIGAVFRRNKPVTCA